MLDKLFYLFPAQTSLMDIKHILEHITEILDGIDSSLGLEERNAAIDCIKEILEKHKELPNGQKNR